MSICSNFKRERTYDIQNPENETLAYKSTSKILKTPIINTPKTETRESIESSNIKKLSILHIFQQNASHVRTNKKRPRK
jgi:hypothetical protein